MPESRRHGGLDELTGHILVLWMPAIPADMKTIHGYEIFRKYNNYRTGLD